MKAACSSLHVLLHVMQDFAQAIAGHTCGPKGAGLKLGVRCSAPI